MAGSRAGAHVRLPHDQRAGVQAPVEVRRRAPRLLPPQEPRQGPQRPPELLPHGLPLPLQVASQI